jgi:hypothetical protein
MTLLAFKLILAPLLITIATLVGRRWGHGVSGWLAALPITSGPISLIFALQNGTAFAAQAAVGTLGGEISVCAFCLTYCTLARRFNWTASVILAILAFFAATAALNTFFLTLIPVYFAVVITIALTLRLIPVPARAVETLPPPFWDLPARIITAVLFVLVITYVGEGLGPQLAGLITPFPIFAIILAVFAHMQRGAYAAIQTLRGILTGLFGFATFFLVVGAAVTVLPIPITYTLAIVSAIAVNIFTLRFLK